MIIALTGTPGTGKTTVSHLLDELYDFPVINLHEYAKNHDLICEVDKKRKSDIIDIDELDIKLRSMLEGESLIILDGHISHMLGCVTKVIVLRCHPKILKERLKEKQWSEQKIKENIEAEILDIIETEAVDINNINDVIEIDTSEQTPKKTTQIIHSLIETDFLNIKGFEPGTIDWTDILMSDEFSWIDDV